jgi:starch synthase
MQAMTCGTIPVVTDVGGLRDTVTDTDLRPRSGTGYLAAEPSAIAVLDAVHRAVRGWSNPRRRASIQRRGMTADWSWAEPARRYQAIYDEIS